MELEAYFLGGPLDGYTLERLPDEDMMPFLVFVSSPVDNLAHTYQRCVPFMSAYYVYAGYRAPPDDVEVLDQPDEMLEVG